MKVGSAEKMNIGLLDGSSRRIQIGPPTADTAIVIFSKTASRCQAIIQLKPSQIVSRPLDVQIPKLWRWGNNGVGFPNRGSRLCKSSGRTPTSLNATPKMREECRSETLMMADSGCLPRWQLVYATSAHMGNPSSLRFSNFSQAFI